MKLDPKGIEAAQNSYRPNREYGVTDRELETAILAYLKATDSVIVPRTMALQMIIEDRSTALDDLAKADQEEGLI